MILNKFVGEINGSGNKYNGRWWGTIDLVQREINAPEFRQVRAARGRNTLFLYGCNNFPWGGSLQEYVWLQEYIV